MLLDTNVRPVVPLPLAHEGAVEAREVADRCFVREVPQALGERREARLAADEDGRPDHLAEIKIGRLLDTDATLDGLREAVSTLEDVSPTARRLLGGAHPTAPAIEEDLRDARAALRAREPPSSGSA